MTFLKEPVREILGRILCIGLLLCCAGAQSAYALDLERKVRFDIPAGKLPDALIQFSRQAQVQVLTSGDVTAGAKTDGISGSISMRSALTKLLKSSGLEFKVMADNAIAIGLAGKPKSVDASGATADAGIHLARLDPAVTAQADSGNNRRNSGAKGQGVEETATDELVVEGVRDTGIVNQGVIPREANQAVRYEIIDREAIERSGASSLQELLIRQLPQAAGVGTDTQRMLQKQANVQGGLTALTETLDLRGFGSNQTLILVNGRRLYGSEDEGADISRIPLSAVERVEVSPSSGSAIYGANAMAGVVNIVLRKDYAGTGMEMHLGASQGGAEELRLALTQGLSFNDGRTNQTIFAEYKKSEALTLGERGYLSRYLDRNPPGSPGYVEDVSYYLTGPRATIIRSPASGSLGIPGSPGAFYAVVPAGTNGVGLTPASFAATAGQVSVDDTNIKKRHIVSPGESASLFTTLEHAIRGDRLAVYLEGSYRWADNGAGSYEELPAYLTLSDTHPLNPFRDAPGFTGSSIGVRVLARDIPRAENTGKQQTFRVVGGVKGAFNALRERDFKWAIDASWDRNETDARNTRYQTSLAIAVANGLYNPLKDFTTAPLLPQSELDNLRTVSRYSSNPEITATNWRLNGELFDAWGGSAQISLGAEYRHEYYRATSEFTYGAYADLPPADNEFPVFKDENEDRRTTRGSMAGYMEVNVPLVGAPNRMPLLYSLDVSAAMRHEKYDDFEAANPPMLAVKWGVSQDIALRAQFSEGFQPPTQDQLTATGFSFTIPSLYAQYADPLRPGLPKAPDVELSYATGNPQLRPETSETLDAGIVFTPRWLPGLTMNVAYFRYDKKNQPEVMETADAALNEALVVRGPNEPGDPAGVPGPIIGLNMPYVNVSRQFSDGIDYSIDYQFLTAAGSFLLSAQATNVRSFSRQLTAESEEVDTVADFGNYGTGRGVLKWRGKAGLSWERDRWGASWTARYLDGFTYSNPFDGTPYSTPSNIEHDVQLRYTFVGAAGWRRMLENARWNIGVMNVFDRAPPYMEDSVNSWYSGLNDPRQRFIYADFRKSF